jgi:hypothetical protein
VRWSPGVLATGLQKASGPVALSQFCLLVLVFVLVVLVLKGPSPRASQVLNHLSHSTIPFWVGYFQDRVFMSRRAPWSSYLCFLCSWGDQGAPLWSAIGWDGVSRTFCPGWPRIVILLIFTSQVVRITGRSHHAFLDFLVFWWWYWDLNLGLPAYQA